MPNSKQVFLSSPFNRPFHTAALTIVEEGYKAIGFVVSNPSSLGFDSAGVEALVTRICLLGLSSEVWFPKDFERDPICVAEYNYAYALGKRVTIDKRRILKE